MPEHAQQPRVIRHGTVDSTNERAFAALAAGEARHFDAHLAHAQLAGRGRLGRTWHSPPGNGLYVSVVLLPPPPGWSAPAIAMAAGLAARDVALEVGVADARLKWPNDVLVRGAKLCGVLVESRGFDPEAPHYVVGLGMNVKQTSFPLELSAERAVTSLALEARAIEPEQAAERWLALLARRLEQARGAPVAQCEDYLGAAGWRGARVEVEGGGRVVRGRLCGLEMSGVSVVEERVSEATSVVRVALEHVVAVRVVG